MKAKRRIDFKSFDGQSELHLGQGANCVGLWIVGGLGGGIVLTPGEAEALAKSLRRRAKYARLPG